MFCAQKVESGKRKEKETKKMKFYTIRAVARHVNVSSRIVDASKAERQWITSLRHTILQPFV